MSDLTRRQVIKLGAAGAMMLPFQWTAVARAASTALPEIQAAGDLALWYDEPAGQDWLRALPVGNGRLGAMVFGNTDTERLQLNEDTVWRSVRFLALDPLRRPHSPATDVGASPGAAGSGVQLFEFRNK
jgi:alpha-L-fucosidase 2